MRRKFEVKNEEAQEDWLLSYADMITLLMAFFIMLAAISKVDANLFEKVQSGMAKDVGNRRPERPLQAMQNDLQEAVIASRGDDVADIGSDERGVVMNLDAGALFAPGSAELKSKAEPVLKEIVATLNQERFSAYRVEIQGHTDDTLISTSQYPSNFDLAAARAMAVLRLMVSLGLPEERMLAASYGAYAPRVPNHMQDGTPLPINQALNRRVSVHVYPR